MNHCTMCGELVKAQYHTCEEAGLEKCVPNTPVESELEKILEETMKEVESRLAKIGFHGGSFSKKAHPELFEPVRKALESYAQAKVKEKMETVYKAVEQRRWKHPVPETASNEIKQCHYQHEAIFDEILELLQTLKDITK